jgi:hypothetical protein
MEHEALNNVRRKINEILKKDGERIVVGWRPGLEEKRNEGDVWETPDGKKWTMQNGVRQRVTKLESANVPWWCPKCQKSMSHHLDTKFWRLRGHCFDCNVKEETRIRAEGRWKEYEETIMKKNYIARLRDTIAELRHYHDNLSNPEFIHFDEQQKRVLLVEKWNVNMDTVQNDLREEINRLEEKLAEVESL